MASTPVLPGDATLAVRSGFGQGFGVAFGGVVTTVEATLTEIIGGAALTGVTGGAALSSNGVSAAVVMSPALQTT